jgi:hypothetical protein
MESNYNNKDFEQFVRQNADQYRMFPSEKVWAGIDNALHTRRKWYGVGLALLLLLTGASVTWVMMTTSGNDSKKQPSIAKVENVTPAKTPITPALPVDKKVTVAINPNAPVVVARTPVDFPQGAMQGNTEEIATTNTSSAVELTVTTPDIAANNADIGSLKTPPAEERRQTIISQPPHNISSFTGIPASNIAGATDAPTVTDKKDLASTKVKLPGAEKDKYPMTIESVVNSYKKPAVKNRLSWQVYAAPTVSYRKLSENKEFLRSAAASGNVPNFAAFSDVKNMVTHKPDLGLEVGVAARYALGKNFTIRGGLQFNVSRYDIKAFSHPGENVTIALDDNNGSISTIARYRNFNGLRANWLQNLYYSASAPIGLEWKATGNKKKTYFGIASTIQPTYVIKDRAFLLSTDYKNYAEVPWLIRRWNMNTSFETFVSYSNGVTRWQIGPQVRYQIRSSFHNEYPVKENLFDFGLKVGVIFEK